VEAESHSDSYSHKSIIHIIHTISMHHMHHSEPSPAQCVTRYESEYETCRQVIDFRLSHSLKNRNRYHFEEFNIRCYKNVRYVAFTLLYISTASKFIHQDRSGLNPCSYKYFRNISR